MPADNCPAESFKNQKRPSESSLTSRRRGFHRRSIAAGWPVLVGRNVGLSSGVQSERTRIAGVNCQHGRTTNAAREDRRRMATAVDARAVRGAPASRD